MLTGSNMVVRDIAWVFALFGLVGMVVQGGAVRPLVRRIGEGATARTGLILTASGLCLVAIEGSTAHLKLTAFPSNPNVTVGTRFSVAVQVEPNPDIHLYAPGAEAMGYRVVSLNFAPVPHVRFEPVEFPESEIYYFEPLDERVPTYQRPFTLLQEITVSSSEEAEAALRELDALTLSGTLDYQACDDVVCFEPVSVPVSFTLDLDLLDRIGANR